MNKDTWISGITAFVIAAGGALAVVLVGEAPPTMWQVLAAIVLGLVSGAKDVRSLMKLPPLVLLLSIGLAFGSGGCAIFKDTTPAKAAVNVSDVSKVTVEAALRAWDDYIVLHHPPLSQQRAVKEVWKDYQAAQVLILDVALLMKETENAGGATPEQQTQLSYAIAEASNALADLIKMLQEFGVKL